jgi:hypothetical protein
MWKLIATDLRSALLGYNYLGSRSVVWGVGDWPVVASAAAGRPALIGCPQGALVSTHGDDGLHRAFAERARANKRGALVILQRTSDDFRGRR